LHALNDLRVTLTQYLPFPVCLHGSRARFIAFYTNAWIPGCKVAQTSQQRNNALLHSFFSNFGGTDRFARADWSYIGIVSADLKTIFFFCEYRF
jgi:hypothetical protein